MLCCLLSVNVFAQITKNTTAKHTPLGRSHTIVKWYMDEGVFQCQCLRKVVVRHRKSMMRYYLPNPIYKQTPSATFSVFFNTLQDFFSRN